MLEDAEYQKEYDKAAAALEAAANPTTAPVEIVKEMEAPAEPAKDEPSAEPDKPIDPLAEIREKLEKTEKALKDTQAWGTRNAQDLAELKRAKAEEKRAAERPSILDANPELEAAIKYIAPQPDAPAPDTQKEWQAIVSTAHPGIFDTSIEPELEQALMARLGALGDQVKDPLVAIREITAEKLAYTERQLGKRFAAESAKVAQKSAMAVPGAGAGGAKTAPLNADLEAKNRILNMSPADFEKERRKVLGY